MTTVPRAIARWHRLVAARSIADLDDLLAEKVVFQWPAVHTPQAGKAVTKRYLHAALQTLIPRMSEVLQNLADEACS